MTSDQLGDSPFRQPSTVSEGKQGEEEFVLKIRRNLENYRKWRPWLIGLHLLILVALVCLGFTSYRIVDSFSARVPPVLQQPPMSFTLGIMLGAKIGFWLLVATSALKSLVFEDRQAELLVKYYDRLKQQPCGGIDALVGQSSSLNADN